MISYDIHIFVGKASILAPFLLTLRRHHDLSIDAAGRRRKTFLRPSWMSVLVEFGDDDGDLKGI